MRIKSIIAALLSLASIGAHAQLQATNMVRAILTRPSKRSLQIVEYVIGK